jgi:hypothetical protein
MSEPETHPVQTCDNKGGRVPVVVTMLAYEVYKAIFGEQRDLITGSCRGGFGTGELIAFLYARNFPRNEWSKRFNEAITGMVHV